MAFHAPTVRWLFILTMMVALHTSHAQTSTGDIVTTEPVSTNQSTEENDFYTTTEEGVTDPSTDEYESTTEVASNATSETASGNVTDPSTDDYGPTTEVATSVTSTIPSENATDFSTEDYRTTTEAPSNVTSTTPTENVTDSSADDFGTTIEVANNVTSTTPPANVTDPSIDEYETTTAVASNATSATPSENVTDPTDDFRTTTEVASNVTSTTPSENVTGLSTAEYETTTDVANNATSTTPSANARNILNNDTSTTDESVADPSTAEYETTTDLASNVTSTTPSENITDLSTAEYETTTDLASNITSTASSGNARNVPNNDTSTTDESVTDQSTAEYETTADYASNDTSTTPSASVTAPSTEEYETTTNVASNVTSRTPIENVTDPSTDDYGTTTEVANNVTSTTPSENAIDLSSDEYGTTTDVARNVTSTASSGNARNILNNDTSTTDESVTDPSNVTSTTLSANVTDPSADEYATTSNVASNVASTTPSENVTDRNTDDYGTTTEVASNVTSATASANVTDPNTGEYEATTDLASNVTSTTPSENVTDPNTDDYRTTTEVASNVTSTTPYENVTDLSTVGYEPTTDVASNVTSTIPSANARNILNNDTSTTDDGVTDPSTAEYETTTDLANNVTTTTPSEYVTDPSTGDYRTTSEVASNVTSTTPSANVTDLSTDEYGTTRDIASSVTSTAPSKNVTDLSTDEYGTTTDVASNVTSTTPSANAKNILNNDTSTTDVSVTGPSTDDYETTTDVSSYVSSITPSGNVTDPSTKDYETTSDVASNSSPTTFAGNAPNVANNYTSTTDAGVTDSNTDHYETTTKVSNTVRSTSSSEILGNYDLTTDGKSTETSGVVDTSTDNYETSADVRNTVTSATTYENAIDDNDKSTIAGSVTDSGADHSLTTTDAYDAVETTVPAEKRTDATTVASTPPSSLAIATLGSSTTEAAGQFELPDERTTDLTTVRNLGSEVNIATIISTTASEGAVSSDSPLYNSVTGSDETTPNVQNSSSYPDTNSPYVSRESSTNEASISPVNANSGIASTTEGNMQLITTGNSEKSNFTSLFASTPATNSVTDDLNAIRILDNNVTTPKTEVDNYQHTASDSTSHGNTARSAVTTASPLVSASSSSLSDECELETHNCDPDASCNDTADSYVCTCNTGFSGNGTSCEDINECATGTSNCHDNADCENINGSFVCNCKTGYSGDGTSCEDIDDCATGTHNCSSSANCTNNNGSYSCTCNSGYTGDGTNCTDINECSSDVDNCHVNADCNNNDGSFSCSCKAGFTGNGVNCTDIDDCTDGLHNCDDNAECSNNDGAFNCTCKIGYTGNGTTCADINECATGTSNCHDNADCENINGSFVCTCKAGYSGDGTSCEDIDDCTTGTHDCSSSANCTNSNGSYSCTCNSGYTGDGTNCTDIDECSSGVDNCHMNADCNNNDGSFSCSCKAGYTGNGVNCSDIDDCTDGLHDCDDNAECSNNDGAFNCSCKTGYTGNGTTCSDINECTTEIHDCDANASCNNTEGSYTCSCQSGFTGNGMNCTDIDECTARSHNCDINAECSNNKGAFSCSCKTGYTGNGTTCSDIDECTGETHNCNVNASCTNNDGSYTCSCDTGFTGNGITCSDVDECADESHNCNQHADCSNSVGSFSCACSVGFTGNGLACSDIDECTTDLHNCDSTADCRNTNGSFSCTCMAGYTGDGATCEDIDECAGQTDDCHSNANCTNSYGSFSCSCKMGFSGNGISCSDIDECTTNMADCHSEANCTNNEGSFVCSCKTGYTGNGTYCEDLDECVAASDNCNDDANCTNTVGSFSCACQSGYTGNGLSCTDFDECQLEMDDCEENSTCSNTKGSFTCLCKEGFTGDGFKCFDIDECALGLHSCHANADCTNNVGSFSCACKAGFSGDGFTCEDIDECASEETNDCSLPPAGVCTNEPGTFTCSCGEGYEGDGKNCLFIETPELQDIARRERSARLEIMSDLRHQEYEIELLDTSGSVLQNIPYTEADINLVVNVRDLTPNTTYNARARIVRLRNGYTVVSEWSIEISFQTEPVKTPCNLAAQRPFEPAFNDLSSPLSIAFIDQLILVITGEKLFIIRIRIVMLLPGSTIAVSEIETDPQVNETLDSSPISNPNYTLTVVPQEVDAPPENLTVSDVTTSSFALNWDSDTDAVSYEVKVDYLNASLSLTANQTMIVVKNLPSNTAIVTYVRAVIKENGTYRFSNVSEEVTFTTVAEGPKNLKVSVLNGSCLTVIFDTVPTANEYYIQISGDGYGDLLTVSSINQVNGTVSQRLDKLTPETSYDFIVLANVGGRNSTDSRTNATTGPATVSGVSIYNVTTAGFNVEFDAVVITPEIATTYIVKYTSEAGTQEIPTSNADIFIPAPNPITNRYNVTVAYKTIKMSLYSSAIDSKIWSIGSVTTTTIALSWDAYNSAIAYDVMLDGTSLGEQTTTSTEIESLTPGSEYLVRVSAGGKNLFTLPQLTCPPPVTSAICGPASATCIGVNFTSTQDNFKITIVGEKDVDRNVTETQICDLVSGSSYTVEIKAVNSQCESSVVTATNCLTDVDECLSASNECHSDAQCANSDGSYDCTCRSGYTGTGRTCSDIDECQDGYANDCVSNSDCANAAGNYSCSCKAGYQGVGTNFCLEILATPVQVSVFETGFIVQLQPKGSFGSYEFKLYTSAGGLLDTKTTSGVTVEFGNLTAGTTYSVTGRILTLANTSAVSSNESEALTITTKSPTERIFARFTDITYNDSLLDRSHPYFSEVSSTCQQRIETAVPGLYTTLTIVGFYSGSTGAIFDGEKNSASALDISTATLTNGEAGSVSTSTTTPPTVAISNPTANGFDISWSQVDSAFQYVSLVECGNVSQSYNVPDLTVTVSDLTSNTRCSVRVQAFVDVVGTEPEITGFSEPVTVTTLAKVPSLTVTALGSSSIRVQFGFVSGASAYRITLNDTDRTSVSVLSSEISGNVFVKDIANVASGNVYLVSVTPEVDGVTGSVETATITLVSTVTGVTLYNITKDGMDVAYDAILLQGGTAVTYIVRYDNGSAQESETSSTTFHIPSDPIGTPYQVSVAYRTDTSAPSVYSVSVSSNVSSISDVTTQSISMSWTAIQGVPNYISSSNPFIANPVIDSATTRNFAGLSPGTSYELKVNVVLPVLGRSELYFEAVQVTVPGPVTGARCAAVSATCFKLKWTLSDQIITDYAITTTHQDPAAVAINVTKTIPEAEVCQVDTGRLYNATVTARNSAGSGESVAITDCHTALPPPTNVRISVVNQSCLEVHWDANSFAKSFNVTLTSNDQTLYNPVDSSPAQFCNLQVSATYSASVSSFYESGESSFTVEGVSQITAPTAPTLSFSSASETSISLSWAAVNTATNYYVKTSRVEPAPLLVISTETSVELSLIITGLDAGTVYSFTVYAENAGGNSSESTALEQITVPKAVTGLAAATANVQRNVAVTWDSIQGAAKYQITLKDNSGTSIHTETVSTNGWTGTDSILSDGHEYTIEVKAETAARTVTQVNSMASLLFTTAPSVPTNARITSITTTSFTVEWDAASSATLYEVQVTPYSGGAAAMTQNTSSLAQSFSDLSPGVAYNVTVRARNTGGWSLPSDAVVQITVPLSVNGLSVTTPVAQTSFVLTWNAVTGADSYDVSVTTAGGASETSTANDVTIEFTGRSVGTAYSVSIVAKTDSSLYGAQQTSAATTLTLKTAPSDPGEAMVITKEASSIELNWTLSVGADRYELSLLDTSNALQETKNETNTALFTALSSGTCYTLRIKAVNEFGSSQTVERQICTRPNPPDFSITAVTPTSITLTWTAVPGARVYSLTVVHSTTGEVKAVPESPFTEATTVTVQNLLPGAYYNLTMVAVSDVKSDPLTKSQLTGPATPTIRQCSPLNATCFKLEWIEVSTAVNYTVAVNDATPAGVNVEVNSDSQTADICGVTTGTLYSGSVFATNLAGSGAKNTTMTCHSELPAPSGIAISVTNQTCFTVSWNEVPTATGYDIKLTNISDGTTETKTVSGSTSVEFCQLLPATIYNTSVLSYYDAGTSAYSSDVVQQITAPTAPVLELVNATTSSVSLKWSVSATATSYYVKVTPGTDVMQMTKDAEYIFSGLTAGTVYSFTVKAENDGGNSTESTAFEQITVPSQVSSLLSDTSDTQLSVVLNWNSVAGAQLYQISITQNGKSVANISESGVSWTAGTELDFGMTYNATIVAITAARTVTQESMPYTISFQTAPTSPTGVTFRNINTNSLEVLWDASATATSYEITLKTSTGTLSTDTTGDTSRTYNNLSPGNVYTVLVRARNGGGWSSSSVEVKQITVPSAVSVINITMPVPQTWFRLLWESVIGADSYNVTVTDGSTSETQNVASPTVEFNSKTPGVAYNVTVVAITVKEGQGVQQVSEARSLSFETAPANTTVPTATERGDTSISIVWATAVGADYYDVTVIGPSGFTKTVNSTANATTLTDLPSGTCFTIEITSVNSFGESSIIRGTDICTRPSAPDFQISEVTANSISVTWEQVSSAIGYVIEVIRTNDSTNFNPDDQIVRTESVTIPNLSPGTNYTIMLATVGIQDNSAKTSKIQITVPGAPTLTLTNRTTDMLLLVWAAVEGADDYLIQYKKQSDAVYLSITTSEYSGLLKSLEPGTMYDIRVSAQNSAGSSQGNASHSTVISSGPNFVISGTTSSGFDITITDVNDRESFEIEVSPDGAVKSTTNTSTTISGLSSGARYTVRVIVKYVYVGQSSGDITQGVTILTSAPTNFARISNAQDQRIQLSWDAVPNAVSYNITANGQMYSYTNSPAIVPTVLGITYNYTIQAVNSEGQLGDPAYMTVAADPANMFTLEFTLSSDFSFSVDLRDTSSQLYKDYSQTVVTALTNIFTGVSGIVEITVIGFFEGSVIARVNTTVSDPISNETDLIAAFDGTAASKADFNTSQPLTTNINECLNIPSVCDGNGSCADTDASFECSCNSGYTGDGLECSDIDECDASPCDTQASCTNTAGSYLCACNTGYTGTGISCTDINECDTPSVCGNATCTNNEGSYLCSCESGFEFNDTTDSCKDIDECVSVSCAENSSCNNNVGSYVCVCDNGYSGDGTVCGDIDECTNSTICESNEICQNLPGSYSCGCADGYQENSDACEDINECNVATACPDVATCQNVPGSFNCVCDSGYSGTGTTCSDIDECLDESSCGEHQTCQNSVGRFSCICSVGFSGDPSTQCLDIDECQSITCTDGDCQNTVGSYYCVCKSGYVIDGEVCVDRDECSFNDSCSDTAVCQNTVGSFVCNCVTGYSGGNDICSDIDECASSVCEENYACNNADGSYSCYCPDGFMENGTNCNNTDECANGNFDCPNDRVCQDTLGSYSCECSNGTTGPTCLASQTCTNCVDTDECLQSSSLCHGNAVCDNTFGSYSCECDTYYVGDGVTSCIGNVTRLTVTQVITKYEYSSSLARAAVTLAVLDAEVQREVTLRYPGDFTFVSALYTNGDGTSIVVTYVIETARPLPATVVISEYYNAAAGDDLFSTLPVLSSNCSTLTCDTVGFCYEYNGEERCGCGSGYNLQGTVTCVDEDECSSGPCDTNANCANSPGNFTCTCNAGYTGDGSSCANDDECNTLSICFANATCADTVGSYLCVCNTGFTLASTGDSCIDQCTDSYCSNGGTCIRSATNGSPSCLCTSSFTGSRCEDTVQYRDLAIAFGVIGGVLLIALVVALVVYIVRRKRGGADFPL